MANDNNTPYSAFKSIRISPETHKRLMVLKAQNDDETVDETIRHLLDDFTMPPEDA